jgi:hypothetical protein
MTGNLEPGYFWRSLRMDELVANTFAKLLGVQFAPLSRRGHRLQHVTDAPDFAFFIEFEAGRMRASGGPPGRGMFPGVKLPQPCNAFDVP